jgi:hypothetical protein
MQLDLIERVSLKEGSHKSRDNGLCVMELVAWVAGEKHTDEPECVCPVIGAFLRCWNDALPTDADRDRLLKPLVAPSIGTRAGKDVANRRAFMCMDWGVRVSLPTWLEVCGERYRLHVAALRALPEVADWEDLANAMPVLVSAQKEADAAWDAAWAAARAAAWDAAWAAARAAARDAAWAAAWDAAWDAAWAAAWAAAWDAAWDAAKKDFNGLVRECFWEHL